MQKSFLLIPFLFMQLACSNPGGQPPPLIMDAPTGKAASNQSDSIMLSSAKSELDPCLKEELDYLNQLSVLSFESTRDEFHAACMSYKQYLKKKRFNERLLELPTLNQQEIETYKQITLPAARALLTKACDELNKAFDQAIGTSNQKMLNQKSNVADLEPDYQKLVTQIKTLNTDGLIEFNKTINSITSGNLKNEFKYNVFAFFEHSQQTEKTISALAASYPVKRKKRTSEGCISP